MLGKLKKMASSGAVDQIVGKISPDLQKQLQAITSFNVSDLQDDDHFGQLVSQPALLSITASSGGITKMIPGFEEKFMGMMLHLRNELVDLSGEMPKLQEGFQEKLPTVLLEGLKA